MNLIIALEQLGFVNLTDFVVDWDDQQQQLVITEWKSSLPQPDTATLQAKWDAWVLANSPTLGDLQTAAKQEVDNAAETARQRYITPGAGQSMAYQEKSDEATDYAAANYPADLTSYPFIQAEVNATGKTAQQAADDIIAQRSAWVAKGAAIEELRIKAKQDIDAATDESSINMFKNNAVAALETV